jgi:hypothetical protein
MSAAQSVTATFNTAPAGSFTLALAPAAITVTAGGAAVTSTATIARASGFTGAVDLALTGAPAGLTVTAAPANVTGTTSTISATAAATVAPGSYPVTVTGTGTGVASQTATLTITVAGPQSFALAVTPASVSVQQGATGTATVNVTRAGGFTGAVALTATGAPAGLTVTPTPASATGATSTLTISAGATTAPGTYTITVGGTGAGVANQSATFSVVVTQAPTGGGGNVTYSFAGCDPTTIPIWLAVQNGTGAWTRVTANAAGAFSFTIGATGGVAYVTQAGTSYALTVFYGSGTELAGSGNRCGGPIPPRGTKRLTGSVANVGMTETANVSIGGSFATVIPFQNTAFTLDSVAAGERDLIATRSALTGTAFAVNKVIIRRATNYASTIPTLDFAAAEAFDPVQRTATLNNLGGEQAFASVAFITANTASAAFYAGTGTGSTIPFYGVPTAQLATGDYHMLSVGAIPSSTAAPTSFRNVITFLRAATDRTVTLGPALSTPTVTSLATTPYLRLRAQFASQAQYNGMASAVYSQAARTASVTATAAYFGGVPATWSLDIPDLSAAAFDPTWGLRTGVRTDWSVIGFGGDFLAFAGGTPTDGAQVFQAMQSGTSTAFVRLLRARGIALPSRRQ